MQLFIVLHGRPITKKNHGIITTRGGKPRFLQSDAYRQYEEDCLWQLKQFNGFKFKGEVEVEIIYHLPDRRSRPDLVGLLQATSDILEKAGIIQNDRDIACYGKSHIGAYDKSNPRAEIHIRGKD